MSSNGDNIQKSLALDHETTVQDLILDSIQNDSRKISLSIKSNVLASVQGRLLNRDLGLLIGNFGYLGKKTSMKKLKTLKNIVSKTAEIFQLI